MSVGTHKTKILTKQLPSTPCTPDMREAMLAISQSENKSLAEVQREAFALFLRIFGSNDTKIAFINTKEVQS